MACDSVCTMHDSRDIVEVEMSSLTSSEGGTSDLKMFAGVNRRSESKIRAHSLRFHFEEGGDVEYETAEGPAEDARWTPVRSEIGDQPEM